MSDLEDLVAVVREKQSVEQQAKARYSMGSSAAGIRRARYERIHRYYAPVDGDQWPEDRKLRPNKLHITVNIIKAFVDVEARVLSLLPRLTNKPPTMATEDALKSEAIEELFLRYLESTGWEVWMADWERVKSAYGIGILKPFWNEAEKRPDVQLIEQPQNLLLGYGTSDYGVVDWAIYRYAISALEAKIQHPDIEIEIKKGEVPKVSRGGRDHADPLQQKSLSGFAETMSSVVNSILPRNTDGEYEKTQVEVWDYWYRREDGVVCNAKLVQGCVVGKLHEHPEMPTIPYIVTERDHEPGSPEGMSTAELLIDINMGLNRVLSHYAQLVADNSGTAYQLTGENADSVPEGIVPREDELIPAGSGNQILPIQRSVNNYPIQQLIQEYWNAAHKVTGLPQVMFGEIPGTQTSGRAMAVQIEAAANRLDAKRRRSYEGLRNLLLFWGFMLKKRNPTVRVTERVEAVEGTATSSPTVRAAELKIGDTIEGFENWKIVAPEITPRDAIEHTTNVINKVNAKLLPLAQAMDELGIENPQQMLAMIEEERSNAGLYPADVQAKLAAELLMQQIEQQAQAMAGQQAAMAASSADAALGQEAQEAAPTGLEDMNQPGTAPGGPPPPGAPAPIGADFQPLVRQTPGGESQALSQFVLPGTDL